MKSFTYDTIIVVHTEICTDRKMLKDLFHLFKKKTKRKGKYTHKAETNKVGKKKFIQNLVNVIFLKR